MAVNRNIPMLSERGGTSGVINVAVGQHDGSGRPAEVLFSPIADHGVGRGKPRINQRP